MKRVLTISLISSGLLMSATPVHDIMDSKLKGKSFGGTLDDHDAAQDGLGVISFQHHSGTTSINNELIEVKVFKKLLSGESDKTKTADIRTSLTSKLVGSQEDIDILTNIGTELTGPGLYEFTSHTFTSCGINGAYGPTLNNCRGTYSTNWDENPEYYNMTTQGYQIWTVPADGNYEISAIGASGGASHSYINAGKGAIVKGTYQLSAGDKIGIIVGQRGTQNNNTGGGGGGGGSFVWPVSVKNKSWSNTLPMLAAGGGAGRTYYASSTINNNGIVYYQGSSLGDYLADGRETRSGPGASWMNSKSWTNAGKDFSKGFTGGITLEASGGFGGGGGATSNDYAGGGGGFSGGYESGPDNSYPQTGMPVGGGSIVNYASNVSLDIYSGSLGNGVVKITKLQ